MGAGLGAWGQQPEVADGVAVTVGHVIGQGGQEVNRLIPGHNHLFRFRIFRQEMYFVTVNLPEPVLCDGGMADIAARVAEELFLRHCQSNWLGPTLLGPCYLSLGTKPLVRLGLTKQGAARNGENSPH